MAGSTTQLILTFDQYRQDQMICFQHGDNSGDRFAGIHIWDRSDLPLNEWAERFRHIWEQPSGLKKEAELRQLRADGHLPAQRVFIGKQPNRAAAVSLHDAQGRVRLRLSVAEEGTSAIEFLDEDGEVIGRFPEPEYREQLDSQSKAVLTEIHNSVMALISGGRLPLRFKQFLRCIRSRFYEFNREKFRYHYLKSNLDLIGTAIKTPHLTKALQYQPKARM